ncbi:MAG: tetratricopeptide repeat protein [Gammaproteobacteria bacterium]|nr:tetratricopeptide repeat protein [Gammaproteobacteria bacterium]
MKRLPAIFCMVFLLALASPLYAAPPSQSGTATLTLTNDSEETICVVQISLVTADNWGDDWLGENETIESGQTQDFALAPGNYDVRLLDCDDETLLDKRNLSIADSYELSFTRSSLCERLNQVGLAFYRQAQYSNALEQFEQARTCYQETGDRASEGHTLNNIGTIYHRQGQYEAALDSFQQALSIMQEVGDQDTEGTTLNNIGFIYSSWGQYGAALDYYRQSLTIRKEIGDQDTEGTTLNNIGFIYSSWGQYEAALDYYRQSLTIRKEIGDRAGEGQSLANIGVVYDKLSQYEVALNYYQRGLTIRRGIDDRTGEADSLANIGSIYSRLGQHDTALDYLEQALTIRQEMGDPVREKASLNDIGAVYISLGEYDAALGYLEQALILSKEIGDRDTEEDNLNNIGAVYISLGEYDAALGYLEQALILSKEIGDREGEQNNLNNIGTVYDSLGQYDAALDYLEQALILSREIGDRDTEGINLSNIGNIYNRLGRHETALEYYQQAIGDLEAVRSTAGSEQGRAKYIAQFANLYRKTIELLYQQEQLEQAFQTMEGGRTRAFLDTLSTGQVRLRDDDAAELLEREQAAYAQRQTIRIELAEVKANSPDRVANLEQDMAEAEATYQDIQAAIAAHGAELAALVPGRSADTVLDVEQVQARLDQQTTMVAYYLLEDNILAFILTGDSFDTVALDVTPEQLVTKIIAFRDFANLTEAHPTSAVTLYDMLIAPLKDHLPSTSSGQAPPHLAIIPHQSLHYLPFTALSNGEHYLIDDYTLTVLPSASALPFILKNAEEQGSGGAGKQTDTTSAPLPPGTPALILGNPTTADYDTVASLATTRDSLGSLPFAEKEAKSIAKLFGVEPLIGEAATETAVREQVSEANILHLAAHGQFNPVAPLNSLIALAPDETNDGWLTVGESYGLDLENTDLVVLSACETNLGDLSAGDELVGLTRALIFAGTPSVIASLWAVEDEATSLLMERFYTHLQDGTGKAEALRQAQIEVREEYPNPYYWSGFVLSGDPGFGSGSEGAEEQGEVVSSSGSSDMAETTEGQSSSNCFSLLIIIGALGSVGMVVRRRNGGLQNRIS